MGATDSTKPYLPIALRNKPFLTAREVRSVFRCSAATVRRYLHEGQIKAARINPRRFLYDTDSIAAFINRSNGHGAGN
jgi:hypothetical protein